MKPRVAVAYSAGRDSTALLHATARAAGELGLDVLALHVHHGLSPHADDWLRHAQAQCERWARAGRPVRFAAQRIGDTPPPGASVEAWAREVRYAALREMALAHGASLVLLAHHRRDQAETFLLQALRGAGVAGLAGMPGVVERGGLTWARPWLDQPRERIEAYVRRHRLRHVEDDSNADTRHARNRLRHEVWPALADAFPQAEATLADAAAWAAQATACLDEIATADLAAMADARGLDIAAWRGLSPARGVNALRAWLRAALEAAPPASLLRRLVAELAARGTSSWPVGNGWLRAYRGRLRHHRGPQAREDRSGASCPDDALPRETHLAITRVGRHALPGWAGALDVQHVEEGGVPLAWLAHLELRPRDGGERFQAGLGRPPRSLKKQYQAAAQPAWAREGPLVYSGGQLVFVPGLGLDARVLGLPGQPLVTLTWVPLQAPPAVGTRAASR